MTKPTPTSAASAAPSGGGINAPGERYLDALWGTTPGWAVLACGHDGYFNDRGKYTFPDGGFREHWFQWPTERDTLLQLARVARDADVYVCPMLRTSRGRRKDNGLGGAHAWADVDDWDDARQQRLTELSTPGTQVVTSGSAGHRHVYVALGQWCDATTVESYSRRLGLALGADTKWAHNSVLRLPGTLNHKGRARGRRSTPVELVA